MAENEEHSLKVARILPAYMQVAEQLRTKIMSGELPAGTRLPVENELAATFGVSRSTTREALRLLASQNLIVTSRGVGGGSWIAHPSTDQIADYLTATVGLLLGSQELTADNLLEARRLLEGPGARLAAARRSEDHLRELAASLAQADGVDTDEAFEPNRCFHLTILDAAQNPLLSVMARPVFTVLTNRFTRKVSSGEFWAQAYQDHVEIHSAILEGDPEAAEFAMIKHLDRLTDVYESVAEDSDR